MSRRMACAHCSTLSSPGPRSSCAPVVSIYIRPITAHNRAERPARRRQLSHRMPYCCASAPCASASTAATLTTPLSAAAARSHSGCSALQWPHLLRGWWVGGWGFCACEWTGLVVETCRRRRKQRPQRGAARKAAQRGAPCVRASTRTEAARGSSCGCSYVLRLHSHAL